VWLFYVLRFGDTWSTSRIALKVSRDSGETWSDSHLLSTGEGLMVRSQPIVLSNGDYLLPAYLERGEDREIVAPDTVSVFFRLTPGKTQWKRAGSIRSAKGNLQPAVVEIAPGHLMAYCRRGGGYSAVKDGYVVRSESRDGGQTWTPGVNTEFPNPNAAVDLLRLQNGHLMLVYNDSMSKRTPLSVSFSHDNGKTWPVRGTVAKGSRSFGYPYAIQTRDGSIHLIYTEDRTVIHHAVFQEPAR
jgi:predicted neuraminidase